MNTAPPQWAPPQWAPAPPTERLAVVSLVVALVTPFGFPIVGVAAGAVAASTGIGFFEFGAVVSLLSLALGSLTAVVLGHVARSPDHGLCHCLRPAEWCVVQLRLHQQR